VTEKEWAGGWDEIDVPVSLNLTRTGAEDRLMGIGTVMGVILVE
jgi:hypothetical protein